MKKPSKKSKKFPQTNNGKTVITKTLDDYFVFENVPKDVFGFLDALTTTEDVSGFFAVFDINGSIKATDIYTKEILEEMVIPDILSKHPGSFYKIFPESDFEKIIGKKV